MKQLKAQQLIIKSEYRRNDSFVPTECLEQFYAKIDEHAYLIVIFRIVLELCLLEHIILGTR